MTRDHASIWILFLVEVTAGRGLLSNGSWGAAELHFIS